ncbi:MAG: hypothetical protein ACJARR_002425 [Pseudophaeobacter arcticus]|jgi:hypothetical protein
MGSGDATTGVTVSSAWTLVFFDAEALGLGLVSGFAMLDDFVTFCACFWMSKG